MCENFRFLNFDETARSGQPLIKQKFNYEAFLLNFELFWHLI